MEVQVKLTIEPFTIPKFVKVVADLDRKSLNLKQIGEILLRDLSESELDTLCSDFRKGVFAEAGKGLVKFEEVVKGKG
jgi:hypothetical protein